jgi:hypothetical protein
VVPPEGGRQGSRPFQIERSVNSALPVVVVLAVAATVTIAVRIRARRRYARLRVSGGRKSLVLNLFER